MDANIGDADAGEEEDAQEGANVEDEKTDDGACLFLSKVVEVCAEGLSAMAVGGDR